jgi:DNA-binding LacI/PurR family transcriptional regulator
LFASRSSTPDAIIGSDGAMLGLYRAAGERGIRIPDDVSVIGIDGLRHGEYLLPPLTTIDVQVAALARTAIRILTESVKAGISRQGLEVMPVVLRERASTRW